MDRANPYEWFSLKRFSCCLAIIIAITHYGILTGANVFYFSDFSAYGYPNAHFYRESILDGQFPLWNPFSNCGLPFLAEWNTQSLYPPSLFYAIFPQPWSLGIFSLFHLWWAGVGMYAFTKYRINNSLAASFAGIIFACNGLISESLMWPSSVASLSWMPWVALLCEKAVRKGGQYLFMAGIVGALQITSGTPEVIIFTWILVLAFAVLGSILQEIPSGIMIRRVLIILLLACGLSAAQMLPFFDLLLRSQRNIGYGGFDNSMAVMAISTYVIPLYHCYKSTADGFVFQDGQRYFSSFYLGIATILLSFSAMFRVRSAVVYVLLLLTLLSVIFAMGNNTCVYPYLNTVLPCLGFMRYPVKWITLSVFTIPLLAAYGFNWLNSKTAFENHKGAQPIRVELLTLIVIMTALILFVSFRPKPTDDVVMMVQNAAGRIFFLLIIYACLCNLIQLESRGKMFFFELLFLLLVWFDLWTQTYALAPTTGSQLYEVESFQKHYSWAGPLHEGHARVFVGFRGQNGAIDSDSFADRSNLRYSLARNINLLDDVPKADGFFPLYIREMSGVDLALEWMNDGEYGLEDFIGILCKGNPEEPQNWALRGSCLPLVSAGQQPVYVQESNALEYVTRKMFQPKQTVCLPPDAEAIVHGTYSPGAKVISFEWRAQHISACVESSNSTMLVIAQSYYHNWHAFVDGRRVPLWRANYAFQALEVPAGKHSVQVVYEDLPFMLGFIVSGSSTFVMGN